MTEKTIGVMLETEKEEGSSARVIILLQSAPDMAEC